ncbi:MAG: alpha/beta hydrolase [Acidimicrobiia bacterium]|nr:alpha/beta hydrolase [Acidimicrobiia bacterium]
MTRARRWLVALVALAVTLAACASTTTSPADPAPEAGDRRTVGNDPGPSGRAPSTPLVLGENDWRACGAGAQCSEIPVPLDHDDPAQGTLEIALVRRPATGPRAGTVVVNPGGPGASGVAFLANGDAVPAQIAARFDQVSWDPRGVGHATALRCDDELDRFYGIDSSPDDREERDELALAADAAVTACSNRSDELIANLDTDSTVDDLELIRHALGGEPLNYIGFSYGTLIGLRYLDTHPAGLRTLVLDGVVDPSDDLESYLTRQAIAIESVVQGIVATCGGIEPCPSVDLAGALQRLASGVEAAPLPTLEGPFVGPAELADALIVATYDPARFETLALAIARADEGDASMIAALSDSYRSFPGWAAYTATTCLDSAPPTDLDTFRAFADGLGLTAPLVGEAIAYELLPCASWPVAGPDTGGPVSGVDGPPVLVIGGTGDAATPYESAVAVNDALVDSRLLSYEGEGHLSLRRSECIADATLAYLIDMSLPAEGTTCR